MVQPGLVVQTALFCGAITIDAGNALHLFLGTGETDNSPDSFYGTGVYQTFDGGQTWSLVTGDAATVGTQNTVANPLYGKGISSMIYNGGNLYVADGDGGSGQNEIQTLSFNGLRPTRHAVRHHHHLRRQFGHDAPAHLARPPGKISPTPTTPP